MRCSTTGCDHAVRWLCDDALGWLSPGDLEPGDCLGYVDHEGQFSPGAAVVAVAPVPGTGMWNITTHGGSLVLQGNADVFVFAR